MPYLDLPERNALSDAIITTIGYDPNIRRIFLSEVNQRFRLLLPVANVELIQLELDINELNNVSRLTDGSIPFYAWLQQAARYVRPFPDAAATVDNCIAIIGRQAIKMPATVLIQAPTPVVIGQIEKERSISGSEMVSYSWLEAGANAGVGVVCLKVQRYDNGRAFMMAGGNPAIYSGTGWLLTQDLIISNYHVIEARGDNDPGASDTDFQLQGQNTKVYFDYNTDDIASVALPVTTLEVADKGLDYAILRLQTPVARVPLRLDVRRITLQGDPWPVNIIQHPFGYSKKVALRNNHIFKEDYPDVLYFTDTEKGSSGSPVFNDNWQVIALHKASQLVNNIAYQGKTTAWVNKGVQLCAIFEKLKITHPALHNEILP